MAQVVFMCGPAGSGKSRYARGLEERGYTRLSFDDEAWRRGIVQQPLDGAVRDEIEVALRQRLVRLVERGSDVVLDFSFWSRAMRAEYRRLLQPLGITPETVYLATSREVALGRVRARANRHPDDVVLPESVAARYFDHFEPPTPEEGPLRIIGGD
jgi:predicted kinase